MHLLGRSALIVGAVVLAALVFAVGSLLGSAVGRDAGERLGGPLQQVQTTTGVYVGRIVEADDGYLRVAQPAVIAQAPTDSATNGQYQVQLLATEPYGLAGDLLISEEHVIVMSNVAVDSELAAAYQEIVGE